MPHTDALLRLRQHYQSMPPVRTMDLSIAGYDGHRLVLHAPLATHLNDKGCAFGGSLASMMTLAAWGLVSLNVEAAGIDADIYVADSRIRYLLPLYEDLRATAELDAESDWGTFIGTLRQRGRARTGVRVSVPTADGRVATDFTGRYVAIVRPAPAAGAADR